MVPRLLRVLDPSPVRTMADYLGGEGGRAIGVARSASPADIIATVEASGLRGRGGGGFPTGTKWRTVAENAGGASPPVVVVNAAEGEPGTYKDRAIIAANPYRVLEGAMVAAVVIGADRVVLAVKGSDTSTHERLARAVAEMAETDWAAGIDVTVVAGSDHYLFGEETAMLEVLAGREPFPRLTPPYRRGVGTGIDTDDATSAGAKTVSPSGATGAPPALVNNAETFANVPGIVCAGAEWFREAGTEGSPGTIVCTVSGDCPTEGVGEYELGTPLSEVLRDLGGFADPAAEIGFVLSGVSNPLLPGDRLDVPLDYEAMREAGGGLGTGGFLVFGRDRDPISVVAGISRFLGVESCGQCTPCKSDGLELAGLLEGIRAGRPAPNALREITDRARTVSVEARCFLAEQHELVVSGLLALFPDHVAAAATTPPADDPPPAVLVAPITGWDGERFTIDERQAAKQPDWTFEATYSGQWPAQRIDQQQGG